MQAIITPSVIAYRHFATRPLPPSVGAFFLFTPRRRRGPCARRQSSRSSRAHSPQRERNSRHVYVATISLQALGVLGGLLTYKSHLDTESTYHVDKIAVTQVSTPESATAGSAQKERMLDVAMQRPKNPQWWSKPSATQ